MKILLFISIFLLFVLAGFGFYYFSPLPKNTKNSIVITPSVSPTVVSETKPLIDLSKIKTYEKISLDITKEGEKPLDKEISFFENDKKELFAKYGVGGAGAVAKFDGQKWVFLQSWNGSPDCLIFDNAGVPSFKSTVEFACQIDGKLRAESNSKDYMEYKKFWNLD